MDAAEPEGPARPEEAEVKTKSHETADDGYETSNSGDALRRKPASSPEASPPPVPAPPPLDMPPPDPPSPIPTEERYDALDLHRPDPYSIYQRQLPTYPQTNHQPFQIKQEFDEEAYYRRQEEYFKPNFGQPDVYAAFAAVKRDHESPYDMSQQQYMKRDHEELQYGVNGIKREMEDPYSFVEDDAMCAMLQAPQMVPQHMQHPHMMHPQQMMLNQPKKRGRKKKIKDENGMEIKLDGGMESLVPRPIKERKKHDRFNGMSEEEVSRRTLPDHLAENLDIIIIGINPGLFAAYKGHHYAGPGNHFWKCLYLSGLTREQMSADEDYKLLNFGIGFTNMVARATKGSADLTRREIKEGSAILLEKLQTFRPKVAVFNGKLIYEVFSGKKDFCFGKQPDTIVGTNTYMWVMPSSSARCAQLPRAADKVPFYAALKKFRDYLNGLVAHLDDGELVFPDNTSRRPQEELEIRRLTMEPDPGDTIILEDGTEVPLKKKRGRPKKIKLENGEVAPPTPRAPRQPRTQATPDGEMPPKKKRGRPKKIRPEDQQFLQQNMIPQLPMPAITQNVDAQYTLNNEFQQQTMNDQMQNNMMYQNTMTQNAAQNTALPNQANPTYFVPPQPANIDSHIARPQSGYQHSPSYCPSPRPQQPPLSQQSVPQQSIPQQPLAQQPPLSYQSPRRTYSPARLGTPSYSSPRAAGTPQPASLSPRAYCRSPQTEYRSPMYAASPAAAAFPQLSPSHAVFGSYTPSPSHTPYSQHSSPAAGPGRTPGYARSPQFGGPSPRVRAEYAELSSDISAAISSPGPASPGIGHIDFEPPIAANKIRVADTSSAGSQDSPMGSTDMHAGSNSNSSLSDFNKASTAAAGEMSPAVPTYNMFEERPLPYIQDKREHYYTQEQGGPGSVPVDVGSPRLEQLHSAMYPNSYNRSTPPGGSPFSPHYRPAEHPPLTPGSPHEFLQPHELSQQKSKQQDVAAKSLSGLESLVDQIPSIAEGAAGPSPTEGPAQPSPAVAALEPYPLYGYPYNYNNAYGYWGGGLVRPAPGYLGEWQYSQYSQYGYYPPPQQYLSHSHAHHSHSLALELHKNAEPMAPMPAMPTMPSVPSVGFGGFC